MNLFLKLFIFFAILGSSHVLNAKVHVIGDSHCNEFKGYPCVFNYLGPITMHRVGRDGLDIVNFKNFCIEEEDIVVLAFGEIDVRCHIGKQHHEYQRNFNEIIETLLVNYFNTILLNKSFYEKITVVTYTVTPPITEALNVNYASYGPVEERVFISRLLNEQLRLFSQNFDCKIIDVYDLYSDCNGILIPELSDGNVHISTTSNKPILDFLEEIIFLNK